MDTRELKTFIDICQTHNFSKTGRNLFVSRSAVVQQINRLENNLHTRLFNRTSHGVTLTKAGMYFYPLAEQLIATDAEIFRKMRSFSNSLTIGTIFLNKPVLFEQKWRELDGWKDRPTVKFVELNDLRHIPEQVDIIEFFRIFGFFDKEYYFLPLKQDSAVLAVPQNSKLARKKKIQIADLNGLDVAMQAPNISKTGDEIEQYLKTRCSQIRFHNLETYNSSFFSTCQFNNWSMIIPTTWEDAARPYVFKKVDWHFKLNYGFYYRKDASQLVKELIQKWKK